MTNEYGVKLDSNGYAPSLWQQGEWCALCQRTDRPLQRHEVYHGPFRERSKALGCWVLLCDACHMRLHHKNGDGDRKLKAAMQMIAIEHYDWRPSEFRAHFGKSYREDM